MELYFQWQTNSKSYYDLLNGAIFNDLQRTTLDFKFTPLFNAKYFRNATRHDRLKGVIFE